MTLFKYSIYTMSTKTKTPRKPAKKPVKKLSKLAKAKTKPCSRYWRNKADTAWSLVVRRDGRCLICGRTDHLQAHHLITRWVPQLRHEPLNGVCCCPTHHKWDKKISGHQSPFGLAWLLQRDQPEKWEWLMQTFDRWDEATAVDINYEQAYARLDELLKSQ